MPPFPPCLRWFQMVAAGWKWLEVVGNCFRWFQMVGKEAEAPTPRRMISQVGIRTGLKKQAGSTAECAACVSIF